jgi:hypothetical protein
MNTKQQDRNTQSDDLCIGKALATLFGGTFADYPTDQEFFLSKDQKEQRGFYIEGKVLPNGTVDVRFEGIPLPLAQAILRLVGNGKDGEDQGDHYPDDCFNDTLAVPSRSLLNTTMTNQNLPTSITMPMTGSNALTLNMMIQPG